MYYLLICLLSVLFTLFAGVLTCADFIAITPQKNIVRWEQQSMILNQNAFDMTWNQLKTASQINPTNADYLLSLGRLALIKSSTTINDNNSTYNFYHTLAISYFQRALTKRPTSGLAWAYLAKVLSSEREKTEQFIEAMNRSASLGPYEALNQQLLIPLAIEHWNRLPMNLQETYKDIIKHGLRYHPHKRTFIFEAVVKYNWVKEIDSLIQKKWQRVYLKDLVDKISKRPPS